MSPIESEEGVSVAEDDVEREEIIALEREFHWLLKNEVHQVLHELTVVLKECVKRFPMSLCDVERPPLVEKYLLNAPSTTPTDQVKVIVTLTGDAISQADINLKLPRPGKDLYQNTNVREDQPWRLQQIQDAGNHLQLAITEMGTIDDDYQFKSAEEVDRFLSRVMSYLQKSRSALVNPRKRTLEELHNSKQLKALNPQLPSELALSFFIQGWKLVFAVYHIVNDKGVSKFNRYQAECAIPWINEVLLTLTIGLQTAQQLRDKVKVFTQYQDLDLDHPVASIDP
ncbi:hypothetical protein TCAL_06891 [Tigriopus californicus]|uniref:Protein rogdi n=1 Tax=Tigriopus californicus TaxID=6832 RepID=A0A553PKT0_TIGCA|nr:protein rogdi-like [Tigriopus californicus]TRY78290.1 hypothetical protein TCAL_06891 [Tigriopus californicus]|eukprot:TCALIF_06891-PA protein Name:"Similar to rogdi Protein rogdi (Drosophila melanogaster)" AED:0.05 eAED:0.05 QI:101/1/1/1/0.5/0.8/5/200/283